LQPGHRYLIYHGSFLANRSDLDRWQELELSQRIVTKQNGHEVGRPGDEHYTLNISFSPGDRYSSSFRIVRAKVGDCDHVALTVGIHTNFSDVIGFRFYWEFFNPNADAYTKRYMFSWSLLPGYLTFLSWFQLNWDSDVSSHIFLLLVGVASVFASNPLAYVLSEPAFLLISDHLMKSFFIAAFRLFVFVQLELLRTPGAWPTPAMFTLMAIFFSGYATIDTAAAYDRTKHWSIIDSQPFIILPTEKALVIGDVIYITVLIVEVIVALKSVERTAYRVAALLVVVSAISAGVTGWAHVYCILTGHNMYSMFPRFIFGSTHITLISLLLYLLRGEYVPNYATVEEKEEQAVLEVDLTSDSDTGEEDEEDDEEE
jgi:hypothetical protein